MKVWITGASGQVGAAVAQAAPLTWRVVGTSSGDVDIRDGEAVAHAVHHVQPQLIVHCAAYTAVDEAEREPDVCHAVNAMGAENVARAAAGVGARLIHLSTDFVFDGQQATPYGPNDLPTPLGVYGKTKLEGEQRVQAVLPEALILRTAWVYAARGKNFVHTMLRLMGQRKHVRVVADQVGTPTWARTIGEAVVALAEAGASQRVLHVTDAGVASWYDFAVAIWEEGVARGLLSGDVRVEPIATADYPTPARRPPYSVLDKSELWRLANVTPRHWRVALRHMLRELTHGQ